MDREYGFQDRLAMSRGVSQTTDVADIILENVPGALQVHPAHKINDRHGTDYWVEHARGDHLSVDTKIREEDWAAKPAPFTADDLALETWSVVEENIPGWTRDATKRTDYVLWFWQDTRRWCLIPFSLLCAVFRNNWAAWSHKYKTKQQTTTDMGRVYHSECVFVPRREVWASIYLRFSGVPKPPIKQNESDSETVVFDNDLPPLSF